MKRLVSVFLLSLVACHLSLAQSSVLRLPPFKKTRLPNGVTLLLMEQHEVPIVSFTVALRCGSTSDPAGKEGLAGITNDLLRKGTRTRTAEQISAELDFVGGTLNTVESADFLHIYAEFLKKDAAAGLALLADLLRDATFPQAEIDKLLKQRVDQIRSSKDQAQGVIGTYYNAFLYGKHPYGRPPQGDERSLAAITRDDVVRFYEQNYVAENLVIAVVGDFSTPEMEKLLSGHFEALLRMGTPAARMPQPTERKGRHLLLVDKPDSTQSFFRIGNLGIARTNPDRVALEVVNTLFGGRFTSLLNSELRIKSGLTYGANAYFDRRWDRGPFAIASYTRNATTGKAMDMALDILKELHEKGPTEAQLLSARTYVKGQFPPRIETTDQLASLLADLELFGLDESEVNDFRRRVDAVTVADARRVIRQYYPLENLVFVVIGKAAEIAPVVKKYAPDMQTRPISEPGFGSP